MSNCVFCAIIAGESPAFVIEDNERIIVFLSLENHPLIVTKRDVADIYTLDEALGAAVMAETIKITRAVKAALQCEGVFLAQANEPAAGQDVFHFHLHVYPRWKDKDMNERYAVEQHDDAAKEMTAQRIRQHLSALEGPDGIMGHENPALALDVAEFRHLGYRAVDLAAAHLAGLRERPVFQPMTPDERRAVLQQPLPGAGMAPEDILDLFARAVLPHPMGNGHPRFFGWVNSAPAPMGILAELLAAAMDPSCAGGDHAAIYVERCAVRWLMELVGFPTDAEGAMGLLVSGGSMASLIPLAAARHRAALQDGWNVRRDGIYGDDAGLTLYLAQEGHTCIHKAAELLGLGTQALRIVPVDDDLRLDVAALRAAITADRAAGRRPFCVVASAGTVNTGTVDPLDRIAGVCAEEGLWFHVDGAYGAIGVLDPAVAPLYRGMERADSLALDPHKWLSVPVECGCALVRDGALLRDTFSLVPPYIRTEEGKGFGGLPWYAEYGFQQTRGFRALKLWMTLQHAGRDGLAAMIAGHNRLARHLATLVADAPDLELVAAPELSITLFRYAPATLQTDEARLDRLNKRIMEEVQAGGGAFLTGTVLHGRFALRACIIGYATTADDVAALVDEVRRVDDRLVEQDGLG